MILGSVLNTKEMASKNQASGFQIKTLLRINLAPPTPFQQLPERFPDMRKPAAADNAIFWRRKIRVDF